MKKKCQIKFVDFKRRAKTNRDFVGAVGLYCEEENIAYIDRFLPQANHGSRQLTIKHELVHARTSVLNISKMYSTEIEEEIVELEAIARTANHALSTAETMLKRNLTENFSLHPGKPEDLKKIVKNIFKFIKVRTTKKLIDKIVSGKTEE